ncbi:Zinc finger protein 395 [Plakobranchus ocellatus]|uniref:Zinc finger protein 395 n=1 Tax=Plakobranchus ocellatus TaxID=259542 RepID=A0AAV3ZCR3_9GAST|nr:Zinc finger protein 395 [Plakobranchus ocellatus]
MFGNKRLAKRSIVGTRVCGLWPQDGRYYPGMIQSQVSEESITSSAVYVVRFDDGFTQHVKSRCIVGPGFQPVATTPLKHKQKVFITLNGREVCGTVLCHDRDIDEVVISVRTPSGEDFETVRKLEDVRLLESRKSARLVDHPDTDYSKLADVQLSANNTPVADANKRRMPSHVIDVPMMASLDKSERNRRQRSTVEDNSDDFGDVEMMDETIAAMVLTSLSVSPKSPPPVNYYGHTPQKEQLDNHYPYPDSHLSSSVASSGFYSGPSERDDHSPPLAPLSESAPACMGFKPPTPGGSDDDSSNGSGRLLICEEEDTLYKCTWRGCKEIANTSNAIERHIRRVHFDRDSDIELTDNEEEFHYTEIDVTAQSINNITRSFAAMNTSSPKEAPATEQPAAAASQAHTGKPKMDQLRPMPPKMPDYQHIPRRRHISEGSPQAGIGGSGTGQGGVAFHHSHGQGGDTVGGGFTTEIAFVPKGMSSSLGSGGAGVFDHDYQRKFSKQGPQAQHASSVPTSASLFHESPRASLPITISQGQIQKSLSWQTHPPSPAGIMVSPPQRPNKLTPQERLMQHQAQSPKSSVPPSAFKNAPGHHRRPRSEVRKCRKVYGMEHRDQWCTQCKWKKACTRFVD